MPTIEQIRAARALIGWSQKDLADHSNLSQTGIARIENGTNKPNSSTIERITAAFDKADIEFLGETGVRKKTGEIRTLRGAEGLRELVNDIYGTALNTGNIVYLYNASPENWHKWLGKEWWDMHSERMSKIGKDVQRIITAENNTYFISNDFSEHRGFPQELFNDQSIYSFGSKIAFVTFGDEIVIRVLDNKEFGKGFRVLFDIAWDHVAKPMDQQ